MLDCHRIAPRYRKGVRHLRSPRLSCHPRPGARGSHSFSSSQLSFICIQSKRPQVSGVPSTIHQACCRDYHTLAPYFSADQFPPAALHCCAEHTLGTTPMKTLGERLKDIHAHSQTSSLNRRHQDVQTHGFRSRSLLEHARLIDHNALAGPRDPTANTTTPFPVTDQTGTQPAIPNNRNPERTLCSLKT